MLLGVEVVGLSRRGITSLLAATIRLSVRRRLTIWLRIVRASLDVRLVLDVSCLNDDDLLAAARKEATPDKQTKEKSNGDKATRFNVVLSAVSDDRNHIGNPCNHPDNVQNNASRAAVTSINDNAGGTVIVRIVNIAVIVAERIWVRVGAFK